MFPFDLIDSLEQARSLDKVAAPFQQRVQKYVQPQGLRDLLHGVPIGHPAHPILVQVPIGAWLSAALLDRVKGGEKSADLLIGVGVLSALPAALSGAVDYSEQNPEHARVGFVHSVFNSTAIALFIGSLAARATGRRPLGRLLALAGVSQVSIGGLLGGHIAYHQAGGPNHVADVAHRVPTGWQPVGDLDELTDGKPVRRMIGDVPVLVLRSGGTATVMADLCSHLSAPLHEGEITGSGADRCVVCPWHRSTFRLSDGAVVHGPATAPQPVFDTRVINGRLEACLPYAVS